MNELTVNYYHGPFSLPEDDADLDYLRFRPHVDKRHRRIIGYAAYVYFGAERYRKYADPRINALYDRMYEHVAVSLRNLAVPSYTKPEEVRRLVIQNTAVPLATREIDHDRFAVVTFGNPGKVNLILR